MTEKKQLKLPEEFEKYREKIEETMQPFTNIVTEVRNTTLFESKFEGNPYFPFSQDYPKNSKGRPLKLLAQINFADVPKHVPYLPEKGILQFYIDAYDDILGMDFENGLNQEGFRVIFHEQIEHDESKLIQDFSFITDNKVEMYFPVEKEMALSFETSYGPLSINDFRSNTHYTTLMTEIDEDDDLADAIYESLDSTGHKIGGYPFFTQEDPRAYGDYTNSTILLLQVDTEGDHIMWGDSGVGNFFITEEALKQRDFSKVLYNWDCH